MLRRNTIENWKILFRNSMEFGKPFTRCHGWTRKSKSQTGPICVLYNTDAEVFALIFVFYIRMEVVTADDSALAGAAKYSDSHTRHILESALTPADACALFGQGYHGVYWDADKSKPREFPDGECGPQAMGMLYGQPAASQNLFKKVCSLTGPATSTSCGETGYIGYMNKFASPLTGLVTEKCRFNFVFVSDSLISIQ